MALPPMSQPRRYSPEKLGAICRLCPRQGQIPVPPEGPVSGAKVVFLGQDPGHQETKQGKPFVGPTGARLDHIWERGWKALNLPVMSRSLVLVTNAALCQPIIQTSESEARKAMSCCRPRLLKELESISPDAGLLLMGKWAFFAVKGKTKGIGKYLGFHFKVDMDRVREHCSNAVEKIKQAAFKKTKGSNKKCPSRPRTPTSTSSSSSS